MSGVPASLTSRTALGWWLAAGFSIVMLAIRLSTVDRGVWVDLDVYVAGGRAVLDGARLDEVTAHGLPFTYPPFAAVVFVPLAVTPPEVARVLVTVASIAALGVVTAVVARSLSVAAGPAAVVLLVALSIEPVARTLLLGQVNSLLVMLVVLDLLVVPMRWRGLLLGLATGMKLVPGAFVLVLLMRKDVSSCGRWVAALLATVLVGALVQPAASRVYFGGGLLDLGLGDEVSGVDNQSLAAVAMRATGSGSLPLGASTGLLVLALAAGTWWAARIPGGEPGRDVRQVMIIAVAALLASPVSWTHHWVWLVPMAIALVHGRHFLLATTTALVAWLGLVWWVDAEPAPEPHDLVGQLVGAAYVLLGIAIAVALGPVSASRSVRGTQQASLFERNHGEA